MGDEEQILARLRSFSKLWSEPETASVSIKLRPVGGKAYFTDAFGKSVADAYLYPDEYEEAGDFALSHGIRTLGEAPVLPTDLPN